jgi:hypothetical protein
MLGQSMVILIEPEGEEPYLQIPLAGGFVPGWGIKVGRPTFRPKDDSSIKVYCWKEGVYGFIL